MDLEYSVSSGPSYVRFALDVFCFAHDVFWFTQEVFRCFGSPMMCFDSPGVGDGWNGVEEGL